MLVDLESARAMGLLVRMAKGSKFGTFYGPGLVKQVSVGIVAVLVPICFSVEVVLHIRELKVKVYPKPLLLLGVDLSRSGHPGWDFRGIGPGSDGHGFMTFAYGHRNKTTPLLRALHLANLSKPMSQLLPPPPSAA